MRADVYSEMSTSMKSLQCLCDCQNKHYCSYPTRQRHRAIYGLLALSSSATCTSARAQQMHTTSTSTTAHPSCDAGCTTEPLVTDDTVTGMVIIVIVMNFIFNTNKWLMNVIRRQPHAVRL